MTSIRGATLLALFVFAGVATEAPAAASAPFAATVLVHTDQPGAVISRTIYGQFAEHLGRGIYEGIWVGEDSPIPNTRGYRSDVVAALRALHVPVVRWPGGCFADEYHWREGIGPRAGRPTKINTTWGGVEETNAFGTHEFLNFAELIGADAYVSGNVGSGSPQEMAEWIEYITSDTQSTLANLRRKNGRERPWRLPYFGIGNETWGCGGNMRAEFSVDLYRQFAAFLKAPPDNKPLRVASGATAEDLNWTEVLMSRAAPLMDAYSLHYYTLPTGDWNHKGASTGFSEGEWASTLSGALKLDDFVTRHSAIMDKYDAAKRVGLFVDEWGTWYDAEAGRNPAFLYQQNTLRDAVVAALSLDIFHRHADRVRMANIAQMVNVLQAMILTDKERMVRTPTYYVFQMYVPFQGATTLPVEVTAPSYATSDVTLPALDVSAARDAAGNLELAFVNLDPSRVAKVSATLAGVEIHRASGRVLTADTMDAHNSFEQPNAVVPAPLDPKRSGSKLAIDLPPKSVAVITVATGQ